MYQSDRGPWSTPRQRARSIQSRATSNEGTGTEKDRVKTYAPGLTETEGATEPFFASLRPARWQPAAARRVGVPDDIPAAVFLASGNDSAWLTGESIRVSDGSQTSRLSVISGRAVCLIIARADRRHITGN